MRLELPPKVVLEETMLGIIWRGAFEGDQEIALGSMAGGGRVESQSNGHQVRFSGVSTNTSCHGPGNIWKPWNGSHLGK